MDTGITAPEVIGTLLIQQRQLVMGRRPAQMFPVGTEELPLPQGMKRVQNDRGIFHYDPEQITEEQLLELSSRERENEFLNLGAFSKRQVLERVLKGEAVQLIGEYTPDGIEVRTAVGSSSTLPFQQTYFENTREPGNTILVGKFPDRVARLLAPTARGD